MYIKIIYGRKVTYMDKYATSNLFETFLRRYPSELYAWMLSLDTKMLGVLVDGNVLTEHHRNSVTHDFIYLVNRCNMWPGLYSVVSAHKNVT